MLTLLMSMAASVASAYDALINGIYYNFDQTEGVATVTKGSYSGDVIIPESVIYDNVTYSVTYIDYYAFRGCTDMTSIIIPNSVISIGDYAFSGCSGLKELTIEDGDNTLSIGCNKYYTYNDNGYGEGLFCECPLTTVYLGRNLSYHASRRYGYSPFYNKSSLNSVTIGNRVTVIGDNAFYECTGLISITIPDGVICIGEYNQEIKGETNMEIIPVSA